MPASRPVARRRCNACRKTSRASSPGCQTAVRAVEAPAAPKAESAPATPKANRLPPPPHLPSRQPKPHLRLQRLQQHDGQEADQCAGCRDPQRLPPLSKSVRRGPDRRFRGTEMSGTEQVEGFGALPAGDRRGRRRCGDSCRMRAQSQAVRRIGVISASAETDPSKATLIAFQQGLEQQGWATGQQPPCRFSGEQSR